MMSSILRRGLAAVPRLPTLYAGCAVYTRHAAAGAHVSPQPGGQVPCLRSSSQPRPSSPPAHVSPRAAPCGPRGQRATGPGSSSTLRPSTILSLGPGGDNVTYVTLLKIKVTKNKLLFVISTRVAVIMTLCMLGPVSEHRHGGRGPAVAAPALVRGARHQARPLSGGQEV